MTDFKERLKIAMEYRGFKQADLVRATGISKASISLYLAGSYKPKVPQLNIIAMVLDINELWLMGWDDVPMVRKHLDTSLTPHEVDVMQAYREQENMREAVDRLLGVQDKSQ